MIVIVDYNVGNLNSVKSAFERIGVKTTVSRDPDIIRSADGIVLPGVGAFPTAMNNLKQFDLINVLTEVKNKGIPFLGICLGMQVLLTKGYEVTETDGLGFIDGEVKKMVIEGEKIPHMGWNQLHLNKNHDLVKYIKDNDDVYFVHSFMAEVNDDELVAYTDYGDTKVTAIVTKDNVIGCQFHPEKSGEVGKKILLAFKEMVQC